MKTLFKVLAFGGFLLTNHVNAREVSLPLSGGSMVVCKEDCPVNCSNHVFAVASQQSGDVPEAGKDLSSDKQLPQRFAERGAAKAGAAVGITVGGTLGFAVFGTPGAAVGAALGGVFGEVLGEWFADNIFNGGRIQAAPRWQMPVAPVR